MNIRNIKTTTTTCEDATTHPQNILQHKLWGGVLKMYKDIFLPEYVVIIILYRIVGGLKARTIVITLCVVVFKDINRYFYLVT